MAPSPAEDRPRRSRTGCQNCRRLHRKCDESKPSCSGCLASQKRCVYAMRISWGGRPFKKSTFGQCLNGNVPVVPISSESDAGAALSAPTVSTADPVDSESMGTSFVYGVAVVDRPSEVAASQSPARSPLSLPPDAGKILQNPSHLSQLPTSHRVLLDHFLHTVTRSFSLHLATQYGFCMTYLPMALDSSTRLLPSILEASALHRRGLGLPHDERGLIALRHASICHFIVPTIGQDDAVDDLAIARALMLCLCDILAGGEKTNSWKLHLQGATAMLRQASAKEKQRGVFKQASAIRNFLWRWCESLQVLSLLGPAANFDGETVKVEDVDYIDEFHGFSRRLVKVVKEVHLLLIEQQLLKEACENPGGQSRPVMVDRLSCVVEERCRLAVRDVKLSLYRQSSTFHPSIQSYISPQTQSDFVSVNHAFHHAVLLNLYRRVQGLTHDHPDVEESVEMILKNLSKMELRDEACPGVAMLQPLFDAGCGSFRQHQRLRVLELIDSLEKRYGMGNVSRARSFLQQYWQEWDCQLSQESDLLWDAFMTQKGWELSLY